MFHFVLGSVHNFWLGGMEELTRESGKILVPPKNVDQILVPPP